MTFPPRKPSRVALRGGCQHVCKAHALAHRPATARHNRRRGERLQLRHGNKQKALRNIRSHTELLSRREWTSGLNRHLLRNITSNTELLSRREWTSGQKLSSNARPSAAPVTRGTKESKMCAARITCGTHSLVVIFARLSMATGGSPFSSYNLALLALFALFGYTICTI